MGLPRTPESILRNKGSAQELNEREEGLYHLLVPANERRAIQMEEFSDLYTPQAIAEDRAYVEKKLRTINEGGTGESSANTMRGKLFEAIVNTQIAESDWMGPNADVIVSSRFDDFLHGVDSIVEFEREEGGNSHLALAMDVTESEKKLAEKFNDIKNSIQEGTLSVVKYFKSKNFRGELRAIPHVVVGAGRETVENISDFLLRFKRLQATIAASHKNEGRTALDQRTAKELARVRKELASHPLQHMVLNEIKAQLEAFANYARTVGKNDLEKNDLADRYTEILAIVDAILEEKGYLPQETIQEFANDPIYKMIMEKTSRFGA